ncbi:MAG TPA: hypothetical protein VEU96_27870 [Bryobacteraceae bacterium]|nr:hypothetical protein [Bryobacteraceae bacterium]
MVAVWRIIALALLLLSSADLAAPFLVPDAQSALPPCCRRDGKHHCAMMDMIDGDGSPQFAPSRCPLYSRRVIVANVESAAALLQIAPIAGLVFTRPEATAQPEILFRISYARSRQERGPPVLS